MIKKYALIFLTFLFSATLAFGQYTVDFEGSGETKGSYGSGTVNLSGLNWNMTEALIGTLAGDWKNGARSARLRGYGTSSMTMLQDKSNGLGTISFSYRRFSGDTQVDWRVEYSTNSGSSWTQAGSDFTAPNNSTVTVFSSTVNATGNNIRIRIVRATTSGTSNRRLNIDDITLTDFVSGCSISGISLSNIGGCNDNGTPSISSDDYYTADVTVTYSNSPGTGTMDLTGSGVTGGTTSASVVGNPTQTTIAGVQLAANGSDVQIIATFSDNTSCTLTQTVSGSAISSCSPLSNCVFEDDFNRANNTTIGNGWTELGGDASINANQLLIGTGSASGRDWVYQDVSSYYSTIYNNLTSTITWEFNMRQSRSNPSGMGGGNYGAAFILGSTSSNHSLGQGYAIVHGQSGTNDPVRLVHFSSGISNSTNIISSPDYGTEHLSIRVTYNPGTNNWELFVRNDGGTFADPSTLTGTDSQGIQGDSTYTGIDLPYLYALWNHGSGASETAEFDNICVDTVVCASPNDPMGNFSEVAICNESEISFDGTPPAGDIKYYWQTPNASGTDMSDDATMPLTVSSSADYYVRAYDETEMCWSTGAAGPFSPTINLAPVIITEPSDQTVLDGASATFTATATNATSYQWQLSTDGTNWTDIGGATAASYNIPSASLSQSGHQYRLVVDNANCDEAYSVPATLYVFDTACVDEDFNSFGDWTNSGTLADSDITHYGNSAPCRAFTSGDFMISPSVNNPEFLRFYQDASNGGNGNTATIDYRISSGAWTPLYSFTVDNNGKTELVDLSNIGGVNLSNEINVTFRFNSTFNTWYLDDVKVFCTSCTPPTITTDIIPSSGPVGTYVTINGSQFTGSTVVLFNSTPVINYISQTTNQIVVEVPPGATTGDLTVSTPGLICDSNINFEVYDSETSCQSTLDPIPTDLFIYEVFDENNDIDTPINYGNGGMITIFNGTLQTKDLSDYRLFRDSNYNAGSPNFNQLYVPSGTLAPGEMFRLKITTSICDDDTGSGGYQTPYDDISATGWNTNDAIELRIFDSGSGAWDTTIDQVLTPTTNPGYYYQRDLTDATSEPAMNYNAADWTIDTNITSGNACRDVGVVPNFTGGPPTLALTNPSNDCNSATITVNANEGYNGASDSNELAYEWYSYDGINDTWGAPISTGGDFQINITDNGDGTGFSELVIDNAYNYIDYQFYCRVTEGANCYQATDAARLDIQRALWQSGSWQNGIMPSLNRVVEIDDTYSTSSGSINACSLNVNATQTLTVNNLSYVRVVNDVINEGTITVETRGSFVQDGDGLTAGSFTNSGGTSNVNKITSLFNPNISSVNYTYWSIPVISILNIEDIFQFPVDDRRYKFTAQNFIDSTAESGNDNGTVNGQDDIDDTTPYDWESANGETMEIGRGYAVTATTPPSNANYFDSANFIGEFNTGDIPVTLYKNNNETEDNNWNFIGNPYPSAIDVDLFFNSNIDDVPIDPAQNAQGLVEGAIFLWSQRSAALPGNNGNEGHNFDQNDYAIINRMAASSGNPGTIPNRYIPSGQGFFVAYQENLGPTQNSNTISTVDILFTNSMRVTGDNDQFFSPIDNSSTNRSSYTSTIDGSNLIWLNLTSDNGIFSQIVIGYANGATNDFDGWSFDTPRNLSTGAHSILYSIIEGNDKKFAIQGKEPSSLTLEEVVPLGFYTGIEEATLYKISIEQIEGEFIESNTTYIKDHFLNIIHNISESDYTFTSEVGEFNDRFEIVFTTDPLSTGEFEIDRSDLQIIDLDNDNVKFKLIGQQMASIEIIDLLGRTLYKLNADNASERVFNLPNLSQSTYLAKVTLANGFVITKKAIKRK